VTHGTASTSTEKGKAQGRAWPGRDHGGARQRRLELGKGTPSWQPARREGTRQGELWVGAELHPTAAKTGRHGRERKELRVRRGELRESGWAPSSRREKLAGEYTEEGARRRLSICRAGPEPMRRRRRPGAQNY
jgi:hypothetical protein